MKRLLNAKLLKSLLITAGAVCLPFLTAKAQTTGSFFIPVESQYGSSVVYDNLNNPTDSSVFIWTSKGFPVAKENYVWDNGQRQLNSTGKIVSDTGNDIKYETTTKTDEDEQVTLTEISCNEFGEPVKMTSSVTVMGVSMPMLEVTYQYWRKSSNRLDSVLMNTTVLGIPVWAKTIYTAYDGNGRPTIVETYTGQGSYTKEIITYSKDQQIVESYENNPMTGELQPTEKSIAWLDAQGRFVREESYSYDYDTMEWLLDSYVIYHYTGMTGIADRDLLAQQVIVSTTNGSLSINSPKAETIVVYSLSGAQVYTSFKPSGEIQVSLGNLSPGIYLVKGGSGWVKKIKN